MRHRQNQATPSPAIHTDTSLQSFLLVCLCRRKCGPPSEGALCKDAGRCPSVCLFVPFGSINPERKVTETKFKIGGNTISRRHNISLVRETDISICWQNNQRSRSYGPLKFRVDADSPANNAHNEICMPSKSCIGQFDNGF